MAKTSSSTAPKTVKISRFQIGLNVLVQLLILGGIVLMLNYLSFRHFKRWDFSRDQKYALSSQTRNLLANLQKPARAVIFFSSASDVAPDVNALLREYEFASDRKFQVEIVDPYRNLTRAQDLQTQYKFGASENILILDYDGRSKFVTAAEMADFEMPDQMSMMTGAGQPQLKAFKGEQAITSALLELTEGKPNNIYLITGHGEPELTSPELTVFNESLKRQNIQASNLNLLNVTSVPDDARAVILAGPKYDLSEMEIKLLRDYWNRNGRLMLFLNPFARTPRLDGWLREQGIAPQGDRVLRVGTAIVVGQGGAHEIKENQVLPTRFDVLESGTGITKDLDGVSGRLLGPTQSLALNRALERAAKLRIIPLLQAPEGFWGETDLVITEERVPFFDTNKDNHGPLTLGAAVEKGGIEDARVKVETSRLVVAGNAEMLSNNSYRESEGITVDFIVNALNWLLDREELIGIAPKERKNIILQMTERQLGSIALTVMGFIPGLAAIIGIATWWARRR